MKMLQGGSTEQQINLLQTIGVPSEAISALQLLTLSDNPIYSNDVQANLKTLPQILLSSIDKNATENTTTLQ
jgi:hypothetical protein